uniref:Uncharacterized protein n=1 Tax=Branchiostoma floridae TaxID=7739 RepID=C3Z2F3_BRAFL|eukprot:XP_002597192.1 hypothetical protein BRAFLDRAFT_66319 [Branchiostoma floridae]
MPWKIMLSPCEQSGRRVTRIHVANTLLQMVYEEEKDLFSFNRFDMKESAAKYPKCMNHPPHLSQSCGEHVISSCKRSSHLRPPFAIMVKKGDKRSRVPFPVQCAEAWKEPGGIRLPLNEAYNLRLSDVENSEEHGFIVMTDSGAGPPTSEQIVHCFTLAEDNMYDGNFRASLAIKVATNCFKEESARNGTAHFVETTAVFMPSITPDKTTTTYVTLENTMTVSEIFTNGKPTTQTKEEISGKTTKGLLKRLYIIVCSVAGVALVVVFLVSLLCYGIKRSRKRNENRGNGVVPGRLAVRGTSGTGCNQNPNFPQSLSSFPRLSVIENIHYQSNPRGASQSENMSHGHEIDNGQTPQTATTNSYAQINEDEVYNPQHHTYCEIKDEDTNVHCDIKGKDTSPGKNQNSIPPVPLSSFPEISVTENIHYQCNPRGAFQPENMPHGNVIDNGQTPKTRTTNAYAQIKEEDEYNPQHHTYWEIKDEDTNVHCKIKDKDASSGKNQNPISPVPLSSFPEISVTENIHYQSNPQGAPQPENMLYGHEIDNEQTPQTATTNAYAQINEEEVYNPQHHTYCEIKDEDTNDMQHEVVKDQDTISGQDAHNISSHTGSEIAGTPQNQDHVFTGDDEETEDEIMQTSNHGNEIDDE